MHVWLLRRAVTGLLQKRSWNKANIYCTLQLGMTHGFFCSDQKCRHKRISVIIGATLPIIKGGWERFLNRWAPPGKWISGRNFDLT